MTAPSISDELEEIWRAYIPCDGIATLDIPGHDAPAEWILARQHNCSHHVESAKCDLHYRMFKEHLDGMFLEYGMLQCEYCNRCFSSADDFVIYRQI